MRVLGMLALILGAGACLAENAIAQLAPVRIVLAFPAGGPVDLVARILAEGLATKLGRSIVVENRPSSNGAIAAQAVLASEPYRKRLVDSGAEPAPRTPEQLSALMKSDTAKSGRVIREKKILAE